MSTTILFADLDDTLFQSRRKCPDDGMLTPVAYLKDGSAHSFQTHAQASLLKLFQDEMIVVPVTARNIDAFRRVRIDFKHGAIVNFGGTILDPRGNRDPEWTRLISKRCAKSASLLEAALAWAKADADMLGMAHRVRIIADHGCPFYVSIKSIEGLAPNLSLLENLMRERLNDTGLVVHRNGTNLVALPNWLEKRHAVEFMMSRMRDAYGRIVTIGMGDSLSDLSFMQCCDYVLTPSGSQIIQTVGAK